MRSAPVPAMMMTADRSEARATARELGISGRSGMSPVLGQSREAALRSAAMRTLTYALRFEGEATRVGPDGNVVLISARAPGCTFSSRIGADGLRGWLRPVVGSEATLESELAFTGATTFQEAGTVAFGASGHRLHFSTIGSGHLTTLSADGCRHGAAIWRVESSEGQFTGATGLIVSNFVVTEVGHVTGHHLGVVFVH